MAILQYKKHRYFHWLELARGWKRMGPDASKGRSHMQRELNDARDTAGKTEILEAEVEMLQRETDKLSTELEALWKTKCDLEGELEAQRAQIGAAAAIKQDSLQCLAAYEEEAAKVVILELELA